MNYLVNSLNRNENYFQSDWEDSIPSDIVIPATYDATGTNNSNAEFDYGLIKIVQSYLNTFPTV